MQRMSYIPYIPHDRKLSLGHGCSSVAQHLCGKHMFLNLTADTKKRKTEQERETETEEEAEE